MIHMDKTMPRRRETASSRILEILLAFLIPPLAVLLNRGPHREFVYSIVLTILGFIPGVIYSLYVVASEISDDHID